MASTEVSGGFLHKPLDTIRLLRISWKKDESKFDGHLVPFMLATCPEFIALSYTWGHALHPEPINIDGYQFEVLESIYSFLALVPRLPEFSPETWFWIDSICINQKDEKEKSSQMEIMGKIYKNAYKTVVWLGQEIDPIFNEDSRDCTNAISTLYRLCDELYDAANNNQASEGQVIQKLKEPRSGLDWRSIKRLLLRPWWRRVWTLQEFLISDYLTFYCGAYSISRREFKNAIYAAWSCEAWKTDILGGEAFRAGWNRRRMDQWYAGERKKEMGLIAMLAYVGDSSATDERDRIYSLLGIVKDADLASLRDPKLTVKDVYTELVKSFIKKYNSLDIICYSHLFNFAARDTCTESALPSWIPDWRAHVEGNVVPVMASAGSKEGTGNFRPTWVLKSNTVYKASGETIPVYKISADNGLLTCKGVILDRIDGLGGSMYDDAGEISSIRSELSLEQATSDHNCKGGEGTTSNSEILETISRCLTLNRKDRYLSEEMVPDVFRTSFKKFCGAYFEYPSDIDPSKDNIEYFRQWFNTNKLILIQGTSLEEHCQDAAAHVPVPEWASFKEGDLKIFHERLEDTLVTMARRLAVSEKGYLGMAASKARKGDFICVLLGCSIPVLLREQTEGTFEFIGECYLDGFMNGEATDKDNGFAEVDFHIV